MKNEKNETDKKHEKNQKNEKITKMRKIRKHQKKKETLEKRKKSKSMILHVDFHYFRDLTILLTKLMIMAIVFDFYEKSRSSTPTNPFDAESNFLLGGTSGDT